MASGSLRYSIFSVNDLHSRLELERTIPQIYDQVMQCEPAEELGYDMFFCVEHH